MAGRLQRLRRLIKTRSFQLQTRLQGKGEFTMEYVHHAPVDSQTQAQLTARHKTGAIAAAA